MTAPDTGADATAPTHAPGQLEVRSVNGLSGDPAAYAFWPKTGEAMLFDLGDLSRMGARELLKVRLVLVSHTHIDHFIGFDRLLRVNIPHGREVTLVGPPGLIANVAGKLAGYTWNLLDAGQIRYVVHEVARDGTTKTARIASDARFVPELVATTPVATGDLGPTLAAPPVATIPGLSDGTRIEAIALDHKTPSIAYACQMPRRLHVDTDALAQLGIPPGPWIRDLQVLLARTQGTVDEATVTIEVGGRTWRAADLGRSLLHARAPRPFAYLTDVGFSRDNLERAALLLRGVDLLLCETNYREPERAKAFDRMHLTTRQAALFAAYAGVERLATFHISNLYADALEAVAAEAQTAFATLKALSRDALERAVEAELDAR